MLKENTKRRKWINIRVTKDFQLIDMHFQRYCIENNINETKNKPGRFFGTGKPMWARAELTGVVETGEFRDYSKVRRYSIKEMISTNRISVIMRIPMP